MCNDHFRHFHLHTLAHYFSVRIYAVMFIRPSVQPTESRHPCGPSPEQGLLTFKLKA